VLIEMGRAALKAREATLGAEHPDTLTSIDNLGLVLERQGKYEEAEVMHRRALEAKEKVLGPEHPDTLTSLNKLSSFSTSENNTNPPQSCIRQHTTNT
jgi:Tfp pilus assembly protein PilF